MMFLMSLVLLLLKGFEGSNFSQECILFFRYFLLLSSIIPISMRVNLDFAKLMYSRNMNNDPNIPGTTVRNSNIPEELGRVEYILSDKTGTLTKNEMHFKKLVIDENNRIEDEEIEVLKGIVVEECEKEQGPLGDLVPGERRATKRPTGKVWRDMITALILCHNVTPAMEGTQRVLQGSSPDEVALVKLAEDLKFKLLKRTQTEMVIENAFGKEENYDILAVFPFSS
jgi:phospholipid-translocating ATPase